MKSRFLTSILIVIIAIGAMAQIPTTIPLKSGDLDRFIETYQPLTLELDELGEDFEGVDDYSLMQAMLANEKVMGVFKKYGWDEQWLGKWMTITVSYGLVKMDEQLAELPADQRAQYEQYIMASAAPLKEMVSDEDVKSVKVRVKELDKLFENQ